MARMEAVEAAERAGEAFGRIRTDGVIAEDVQDGMKRRAELITFVGWWAPFYSLRECSMIVWRYRSGDVLAGSKAFTDHISMA